MTFVPMNPADINAAAQNAANGKTPLLQRPHSKAFPIDAAREKTCITGQKFLQVLNADTHRWENVYPKNGYVYTPNPEWY